MTYERDFPKIFVINLDSRVDRKEYMLQQLKQCGLPFQFVSAVRGSELQKKHRRFYRRFLSYKSIGRELVDNEIGCYWSHYSVWERIVADEIKEAIIFEDDVIISEMFKTIIDHRASWIPNNWGIINLAWDTNDHHVYENIEHICCFPDYKLFRFPIHVDRTACYMLNTASAKVLLNKALPIYRPVDSFLGSTKNHGLSIFGIMPRLAIWNDSFPSSILSVDNSSHPCRKVAISSLLGLFYRLIVRVVRPFSKVSCRK